MPSYAVLVNATNVVRKVSGHKRVFACYVTRAVHAPSPEQAKQSAIAIVQSDPRLRNLANDRDDPPSFSAEEVQLTTLPQSAIDSPFAWYGGFLK